MAGVNKLVVGNLPSDITEDELNTVFTTYGKVTDIQILPEEQGRGGRRAHIFYKETKDAEDAITVLNDAYKIRADAEHPIQVWWGKQESHSGGGAGAPAAAANDWGGGAKQESSWSGGGHSGTPPPPDDRLKDGQKLFVGGLPSDITEEELRTVFTNYGEVMHVHINKANTVTGLRGAFVFYVKRESGEDAIKVLNDAYKIRTDAEAPIQVRWAKEKMSGFEPDTNKLFVGSLPPDITEDELKHVFGTYGEIRTVHLMEQHAKTGMRAALVFYARRESGEDAIKLLHDTYKFREDAEQAIQVKWGKDKERDGGKGKGGWDSGKGGWGGGWCGADSWGKGGKGGGSQGWQALGGKGGWQDRGASRGWQDSWSASSSGWQDRGGWDDSWRDGGSWGSSAGKGWGKAMDGWGKGGGKACDSWGKGGKDSWGKGGKADDGWGKGGKGGGGKGGSWSGDSPGKLYVANLPEDIQENALEYVFGTYGKVQKVHILTQNPKNGAVAALVELSSAEEADTAIASLNDKYEIRQGYGPLLVKHYTPKNRSRPY